MKGLLLEKKQAQLGALQGIIITLVVVGIVLGIGFLVLEEFSAQLTDASDAQAGVNDTIAALKKVPA